MKIIAGNWKLNKGPREAREFIETFLGLLAEAPAANKFILFPQALALPATAEALKSTNVEWGGQNIATQTSGALTGENSADVLIELGAKYVLIGHSERRTLYHETSEEIAQKVELAHRVGLVPVLCVGETLEQRKANKTEAVLQDQLLSGLSLLNIEKTYFLVAYEPVWAIGTGQVATPLQATEAHTYLRNLIPQKNFPLLYGGSVKTENAEVLAALPNVDGFLVGGASLDPKTFLTIGKL